MNSNFKAQYQTAPLTKTDIGDEEEHTLWEKDSILNPDHMCGFNGFRPVWLQRLASKKVYMVVFCILSVLQGMFYTYMISILTTVEKRFGVSSKVSGFIMTGNECSTILLSIVISYYGSRGHRPRWVACGMLVSALSCFVLILPEFLVPLETDHLITSSLANNTNVTFCGSFSNSSYSEHCARKPSSFSILAMFFIFFGLFLSGIGSISIYTLALPYMDDNMSKTQTPGYLGLTIALRTLGPAGGFMLGSTCLRYYVNIGETPDFDRRDPRWIGAWWLGFVIIGCFLAFFSGFMALFPRELPGKNKNDEIEALMKPKFPPLKDLPLALNRLITNPILMAFTMSSVFHILGAVGFFTFLPKYLESQFRQSASGANMYTALAGVLVMILGFLLSGFVIQRYRPSGRTVAAWMTCVELLQVAGLLSCMLVGCDTPEIAGISNQSVALINDCNVNCGCDTRQFNPVCEQPRHVTHFSACYAGCDTFNTSSQMYSGCTCTTAPSIGLEPEPTILKGFCPALCDVITVYIVILAIMKFFSSTCRIGGYLILIRCVDKDDKGLTMGFINSICCLLAFLPCTILYGAVVDSTCLVWEEKCGETGNCWIYDVERLRYVIHGLTALLIFIGLIGDIYICYKAKGINLYEENRTLPAKKLTLKGLEQEVES